MESSASTDAANSGDRAAPPAQLGPSDQESSRGQAVLDPIFQVEELRQRAREVVAVVDQASAAAPSTGRTDHATNAQAGDVEPAEVVLNQAVAGVDAAQSAAEAVSGDGAAPRADVTAAEADAVDIDAAEAAAIDAAIAEADAAEAAAINAAIAEADAAEAAAVAAAHEAAAADGGAVADEGGAADEAGAAPEDAEAEGSGAEAAVADVDAEHVHSVHLVFLEGLPFEFIWSEIRRTVLDTCSSVLGRDGFSRAWPGGSREMETAVRRSVEDTGRGPVAHGLQRPQAENLAGQLAGVIETAVVVDREAAQRLVRRRRGNSGDDGSGSEDGGEGDEAEGDDNDKIYSVYLSIPQGVPFEIVFQEIRQRVLEICHVERAEDFRRCWPRGPRQMEEALQQGTEECGRGPLLHGLRRTQAQSLSDRLSEYVSTEVEVNTEEAARLQAEAHAARLAAFGPPTPELLSKFPPGDRIRIAADKPDEVQRLQNGVAPWNEECKQCLGSEGTILGYVPVLDQNIWAIRVISTLESGTQIYDWNPKNIRSQVVESSSEATEQVATLNEAGVPMKLGDKSMPGYDGSGTYYCGRVLGREIIPGSDGQCGPTCGPQCEDCRRAQEKISPEALAAHREEVAAKEKAAQQAVRQVLLVDDEIWVGDTIVVNRLENNKEGAWYAGQVTERSENDSYSVKMASGDSDEGVPRERLRMVVVVEPLTEPIDVGALVRITADVEEAKRLQRGSWVEEMEPCLGQLGLVVRVRDNRRMVVECPAAATPHTWNPLCLKLDKHEGLFCLDLHEHPLHWCSKLDGTHSCKGQCGRTDLSEAYRCLSCGVDVCAQCAAPYKDGASKLIASRHHLCALSAVKVPRGPQASCWPCSGEVVPGGCRGAVAGASCTSGWSCTRCEFFLCDACLNDPMLGECTAETRRADVEDLPASAPRIAAGLRTHPSEIFELTKAGLFAVLGKHLSEPAVYELTLDLSSWLVGPPPQHARAGPVLVDIGEGNWAEAYVVAKPPKKEAVKPAVAAAASPSPASVAPKEAEVCDLLDAAIEGDPGSAEKDDVLADSSAAVQTPADDASAADAAVEDAPADSVPAAANPAEADADLNHASQSDRPADVVAEDASPKENESAQAPRQDDAVGDAPTQDDAVGDAPADAASQDAAPAAAAAADAAADAPTQDAAPADAAAADAAVADGASADAAAEPSPATDAAADETSEAAAAEPAPRADAVADGASEAAAAVLSADKDATPADAAAAADVALADGASTDAATAAAAEPSPKPGAAADGTSEDAPAQPIAAATDSAAVELAAEASEDEKPDASPVAWEVKTDSGWEPWAPGVSFRGVAGEEITFMLGKYRYVASFESSTAGTQMNTKTKKRRKLRRAKPHAANRAPTSPGPAEPPTCVLAWPEDPPALKQGEVTNDEVVAKKEIASSFQVVSPLADLRPTFGPGAVSLVGRGIEANFRGKWYPATVERENGDGTFTVRWHDGVNRDRIKRPHEMRPRMLRQPAGIISPTSAAAMLGRPIDFDFSPAGIFRPFDPSSFPFMPSDFSFGRPGGMPCGGLTLHEELLRELRRGPQCIERIDVIMHLIEEQADLLSRQGSEDVLTVALRSRCPTHVVEALLLAQAPLVEPVPSTADVEATALRNYERAHMLPSGSATLDDVQSSPAGVSGWANSATPEASGPSAEPVAKEEGAEAAAPAPSGQEPGPESGQEAAGGEKEGGSSAEPPKKEGDDNLAASQTTGQQLATGSTERTGAASGNKAIDHFDPVAELLALGEPRIAILLADRGGRWARAAADAMEKLADSLSDSEASANLVRPKPSTGDDDDAPLEAPIESRRDAARLCAVAARRLAVPTPRGSLTALLKSFSSDLLGPLVESSDYRALETNSWLGTLLKAMSAAGCELTTLQINSLAAAVVAHLADEPSEALVGTLSFIDFLLGIVTTDGSDSSIASRLGAAFQRHGVAACLGRLADSGASASPLSPVGGVGHRSRRSSHQGALSKQAKGLLERLRQIGSLDIVNDKLQEAVQSLEDKDDLESLIKMIQDGACTPYELGLAEVPSTILPLLEPSGEDWPWAGAVRASPSVEMAAILAAALQVLLSMCETFPVAVADWQSEGLDCLVQPLELTLEGLGDTRTLIVEPLLPLSDLERFVLQTTSIHNEEYLDWCKNLEGQRIAERPMAGDKPWRGALVLAFRLELKITVHTVRYEDDGSEAKLVLHLRQVVVLGAAAAADASADAHEGAAATAKPATPPPPSFHVGMKVQGRFKEEGWYRATIEQDHGDGTYTVAWDNGTQSDLLKKSDELQPFAPKEPASICRRVQVRNEKGASAGVAIGEYESGALDVIDQDGRFLMGVGADMTMPLSRHATRSPSRAMPFEFNDLPVPAHFRPPPSSSSGPPPVQLERSFSAVDRHPEHRVHNFQQRIPFRRIGEEGGMLQSLEEEEQTSISIEDQLDAGTRAPRLRVHFYPVALPEPLPAEVVCPRGHPVERTDRNLSWRCDGCRRRSAEIKMERFRCEACDYDLCKPCYEKAATALAKAKEEESEDKLAEAPLVEPVANSDAAASAEPKAVAAVPATDDEVLASASPRPDFVSRSVTCPEGCLQTGGAQASTSVPKSQPSQCTENTEQPLRRTSTVLQALLRDGLPKTRAELCLRCEITMSQPDDLPSMAAPPKAERLSRAITGMSRANAAGAAGKSAPVLALLRRLRRLLHYGVPGRPGPSGKDSCTEICWENGPLNRKLADQLTRPLIATGGVAPPWVEALPLAYPFLFQRKLREQLLHCAGFGTSHAVLWLQRQSVEKRYGRELRATGGHQERREALNERIISDQSVFIGPARADVITLPSRADLLKNAERVVELTFCSKALLEVKIADEKNFGEGATQSFYTDVAAELAAVDDSGAAAHSLWIQHSPDSELTHQGRKFLHSRRGLFPRPCKPGSAESEDACRRFRFLGRLMAKALRDGFIVPVPFCISFFAAVLGEDLPLTALPQPDDGWAGGIVGALGAFAADLRFRYASLSQEERLQKRKDAAAEKGWTGKWLKLEKTAGEDSFDDYVQACDVVFLEQGLNGPPLCENGEERAVNIDNLDAFVECAAKWWLREGIVEQAQAFRKGVEDVCTSPVIWAFEAEELRTLFCGSDRVEWTAEDLRKHLRPRNGYSSSSAPVEMLIDELVAMPPARRGQFLEFVTACPRLPQGGLAAAEIAIIPAHPKGSFPHAQTCTKELHLPEYDSPEHLSRMLSDALDNAKGIYDNDR